MGRVEGVSIHPKTRPAGSALGDEIAMDIEESVGKILRRGEDVADLFYAKFLGRHPEARAYFADVNLKRQAVLLTMALKLIEQ